MKRLYIWPITRSTPFITDITNNKMYWHDADYQFEYSAGAEFGRQEISPDELTVNDLLAASSTFLRALKKLIEERRC